MLESVKQFFKSNSHQAKLAIAAAKCNVWPLLVINIPASDSAAKRGIFI